MNREPLKTDQIPKYVRWFMRGVVLLVVIASLVGGCSYINRKIGIADDHPLEQAIELYIESETGLSLDLSPSSFE